MILAYLETLGGGIRGARVKLRKPCNPTPARPNHMSDGIGARPV
jgi:hypothetical protein